MMDEPKTASASLTSMVESHYGVSNLEVDWFAPRPEGSRRSTDCSCRYDTGRRKQRRTPRAESSCLAVWAGRMRGERHGH